MLVDFDLSTELPPPTPRKALPKKLPPRSNSNRRKRAMSLQLFCKCSSGITPEEFVVQDNRPECQQSIISSARKSNSFVGTEEYVAPEVIQGYGHDFSVDWWSLGVVIYEMLYGRTPFRGRNRKDTFYRILTQTPELVGEQTPLRDLIGRLLVKDPRERMTVDEIKEHDFFKGLHWESVVQVSRPPYIPPTVWGEEDDGKKVKKSIDVESFVQRVFSVSDNGTKEGEKIKVADDGRTEVEKRKMVEATNRCDDNLNFVVF
ncbi:Serine/threonine-protein kinase OXI1 [Linum grandiflorum]